MKHVICLEDFADFEPLVLIASCSTKRLEAYILPFDDWLGYKITDRTGTSPRIYIRGTLEGAVELYNKLP